MFLRKNKKNIVRLPPSYLELCQPILDLTSSLCGRDTLQEIVHKLVGKPLLGLDNCIILLTCLLKLPNLWKG